MNDRITYLYHNLSLSNIDRHFANYIQEISSSNEFEIHAAAALVSRSTRTGNVCLDLNNITGEQLFDSTELDLPINLPKLNAWIDKLTVCSAIGKPGDYKPLILDSQNRLYFYRYWEYEKNIADSIKERIQSHVENIHYQKLKECLNRIFNNEDANEMDMQKLAAILAVLKRFCVISGGPGTGKTTTVAKILTLLIEQAEDNEIRILLCAPTGKAAASLSETIRSAKTTINCADTVKNSMPHKAFTIHRLLKSIPGSPYFRHNKENPLDADVVVIDEASMVDIALMSKLFLAIPDEARIILVGDKDQLSSVEAGSALGDICNRETIRGISKNTANELNRFFHKENTSTSDPSRYLTEMQEHIVVLDKNYRFRKDSGIGGLSRAINNGDSVTGLRMLLDPENKGIELGEVYNHESLYSAIKEKVIEGYSLYLTADDPYQAANLFNQFKILCALRSGPYGVVHINQLVQKILHENGLIKFNEREPDNMYKGRPVLITRNDYSLGLFNGDTGIILSEPGIKNGELKAVFPIKKGEIRQVPIHRLPEHETVYAMTIHKSQGSEFNDVLIILPDKYYPILTRELIYTGITRAINSVTIWGKKEVLKEAIARKIERTSGLRDSLWGYQT
ncbi:MAG: exodeoxyribonuclease V subunit alpha [Desulfobacterales bacterium]|nr:exodeoxyribonuclease V subunit alpha [Desulfobacterales bacterium]